jgi:hypothetical protein
MTTIKANIPDYLAKLASDAAEREKISLDQVVSLALSSQVSAWKVRDDISCRAKRADVRDLDRILDRVPDAPPVPGDEI